MAIQAHTWAVGEVVTAANMNTYLRDNLSSLQSSKTVMKVGTYTGDGTTSKAITGVGFTPLFLYLWNNSADGVAVDIHMTTADFLAQDPDGLAVEISGIGGTVTAQDNAIIALGSDGFTVDDRGVDDHPNKDTEVYYYIAWGQE